MYKTLDGKAENEFTEGGRLYSQQETLAIVLETSKQYRELMSPDCKLPQRDTYWLEKAEVKL